MRASGITVVRIGEFAWSRLEPEPGHYEFEWLDAAIEVLAGAGLEIVLCTPTATPPRWLLAQLPDMLAPRPPWRQRRLRNPKTFGAKSSFSLCSSLWHTMQPLAIQMIEILCFILLSSECAGEGVTRTL